MGSTSVLLRPTERQQFLSFVPFVVKKYEDTDQDDRVESIDELSDAIVATDEGEEIDLDDEVWEDVVHGLESIDRTRASWLSTKIAKRVGMKANQMSFTTAIPVGVRMTGETPTRS